MKHSLYRGAAVLLLLATACTPGYVVIRPLEQPVPPPVPLLIGEVVDALPPTVPLEERAKPETIEKLRKTLLEYLSDAKAPVGPGGKKVNLFSQVTLSESSSSVATAGDTMASAGQDPEPGGSDLLLTGKILSFKKGSQAARFFLGFGAGKGEVVVQFALRQADQDLFVANFRGEVASGMEDNDAPIRKVSQDLTNALKKSWRGDSVSGETPP